MVSRPVMTKRTRTRRGRKVGEEANMVMGQIIAVFGPTANVWHVALRIFTDDSGRQQGPGDDDECDGRW
jgi:hypothetical protein